MTSVGTPPVGTSPAAGPLVAGPRERSLTGERSAHAEVTDYDVHGMIGVRLVDAAPVDTRAVERHLRGFRRPLHREPDLVVRFVDRLPTAGLRCVDVDRSGFDDEGFVIRCGAARPGWVRIPFDRLGAPCELVSERGLGLVPHLKPLLRLVALQRGYIPMHASAFQWGGTGVLVTGWTHGGKTSALLAFAEHGARFVGDDLVLITRDGRGMFGLSTPLNVSIAQLRQSPRLRGQVRRRQLAVLGALDRLDRLEERCITRWPRGAYPLTMLRKAVRPVRRRYGVRMPPERAFPAGVVPTAAPRTLFLMMSHRRPAVSVEPVDPMAVVERMVHSLRFEDLELLGEYSAFRFAFPGRQHANELLEGAHEIAAARLRRAFAGLAAFVVRHPYPPPLGTLFDVMSPLCVAAPDAPGDS
ncbi:MAG TPA: hypothetical protein VF048_07765 [Gemmatimonadaceae bacterium]|jgi:hypothetical protein